MVKGKKTKDPFDYPGSGTGRPKYLKVTNVVLFFDIVGFTKGTTIQEMRKMIQKIDYVIDELLWQPYNWDEKEQENDLILISTGDGYGIGFHPGIDDDTILNITRELFKSLTTGDMLKFRMGIAKGPNIRHLDKNDVMNLFGYGINLANRVMNAALENQILIHEDYAKALLTYKEIPELIKIKGSIPIKHGKAIKVYNYCKEGEFGNPQNPAKEMVGK